MQIFKITFFNFLLIFTSISNAQICKGRYQNTIFTETTKSTVKYGRSVNSASEYQDLYMDIYEGKGDTGSLRPLVIFCFGGSFVSGSKESTTLVYMAREMAKRGYVAACIDYRLVSNTAFLLVEQSMIKTVFRAIQDGKAAVRFFRKDAKTSNVYKIDKDQIFMGGTSAGGILSVNLAYLDDINKLSPDWKKWILDIGGLEGNSGNPGYCSFVNGVFSFAGGIADTSFIDRNDPPFYASHSLLDQTVPFGIGRPLAGLAPINLFGSGPLIRNLNSKGIYTQFDSFGGPEHPPHVNQATLVSTKDHLAEFLYAILDCNPSNKKNTYQQDCSTFSLSLKHKFELKDIVLEVFPNPTNGTVNIKSNQTIKGVALLDYAGRVIYKTNVMGEEMKLNLSHFSKGIYSLRAQYLDGQRASSKLVMN